MEKNDFQKIMEQFKDATLDKKIEIYTTTEGLSSEQYKEMLRWYPITELEKLEKALG